MFHSARYSRALASSVAAVFLAQAAIAQGQPATQVAAGPETDAVAAPPPYKQLRYERTIATFETRLGAWTSSISSSTCRSET